MGWLEKNIKGFYHGVSEKTVRIILTNQNNPSREARAGACCLQSACLFWKATPPRCFPKFAVACGGSHCFCLLEQSIVFLLFTKHINTNTCFYYKKAILRLLKNDNSLIFFFFLFQINWWSKKDLDSLLLNCMNNIKIPASRIHCFGLLDIAF